MSVQIFIYLTTREQLRKAWYGEVRKVWYGESTQGGTAKVVLVISYRNVSSLVNVKQVFCATNVGRTFVEMFAIKALEQLP